MKGLSVCKPYIKLYGSGAVTLNISSGGSTNAWTISVIDEYTEIDSELMNCFKGTVLKNDSVTGDGFPTLKPGTTTIACAGNVQRIEVIPMFMGTKYSLLEEPYYKKMYISRERYRETSLSRSYPLSRLLRCHSPKVIVH